MRPTSVKGVGATSVKGVGSGAHMNLGIAHLIGPRPLPGKPWKYIITGLVVSQALTFALLVYVLVTK